MVSVMSVVNVQEAKTRLSELLKRVEAGERITIARAGEPVAELSPARATELIFGSMAHLGPVPESFFDPMPDQMWNSGATAGLTTR